MRRFNDMGEVRRAHREIGGHFFDPASTRFFNSRVGSILYDGRFFITSEKFDDDSLRLYTIRIAESDGHIGTVGDFQGFRTAAQAVAAIHRIIQWEEAAAAA